MVKELTEENKARMTKVIEMTPYMVHLGMELVEASDSYAKLKLRYQELDGRESAPRWRDRIANRHDGRDGGMDDG